MFLVSIHVSPCPSLQFFFPFLSFSPSLLLVCLKFHVISVHGPLTYLAPETKVAEKIPARPPKHDYRTCTTTIFSFTLLVFVSPLLPTPSLPPSYLLPSSLTSSPWRPLAPRTLICRPRPAPPPAFPIIVCLHRIQPAYNYVQVHTYIHTVHTYIAP
jgi:hypothetical protein